MKLNKIAIAIVIAFGSLTLAGCSASSLLSGVIGSKPDVTAQVGAENVKQTVGLTAKKEERSETTVQDSNVGKLDSSTKKTESIKARTITADKIEVHNGSDDAALWFGGGFILAWILAAGILFTSSWYRRNNKGA